MYVEYDDNKIWIEIRGESGGVLHIATSFSRYCIHF